MKGFTYSPGFKLCRFRGGGLDQRDDNWGFDHFLLRLRGTGKAKCRHWINTISDLKNKEKQQKKDVKNGTTRRIYRQEVNDRRVSYIMKTPNSHMS